MVGRLLLLEMRNREKLGNNVVTLGRETGCREETKAPCDLIRRPVSRGRQERNVLGEKELRKCRTDRRRRALRHGAEKNRRAAGFHGGTRCRNRRSRNDLRNGPQFDKAGIVALGSKKWETMAPRRRSVVGRSNSRYPTGVCLTWGTFSTCLQPKRHVENVPHTGQLQGEPPWRTCRCSILPGKRPW